MKIKDILHFLEELAPLSYQESYDNSGLITGDPEQEFIKGLICLDATENVLEEAIQLGCNLIISHHPVLFHAIKQITNRTPTERILKKAIKHDITIYAMHTNLDNVHHGVNAAFSEKLQLQNTKILKEKKQLLKKIITFTPVEHADNVRNALFDAGGGHIGKYDSCSYNTEGKGSFRASNEAHPYVGKIGELHFENEIRIEMIFPAFKEQTMISALMSSHPYEEVAYDIYQLDNSHSLVGSGMIGELKNEMSETFCLNYIKEKMQLQLLQHSKLLNKTIKKVALCGGSGAFLIPEAVRQQADIFITGEIGYHDFLTYSDDILLVAIGHYESEIAIKHYLYQKLIKNFSNFANSETEATSIFYLK
ncbi:MAG TPA: Nif3-like dinuclear metal center hexameric protein [Bacteroidales bacterium]|nr:Nif3-like dinuclear metal center hexameric protein [Bacteroidales bacterium]HOR81384.1 Nif3-like dinuclear metal center hexameric protein [Bacteroidales bacterium]HPJ91757.1 Nif3-like dinuclear metal center hexameric protein [Bacteroidales bacterium]